MQHIINITLEEILLRTLFSSSNQNNTLQDALDSGINYEWFHLDHHQKIAKEILNAYQRDGVHPDVFDLSQKFSQDKMAPIMAKTSEPEHLPRRVRKLGQTYRNRTSYHMLKDALNMVENNTMPSEEVLGVLSDKSEILISEGAESEFYTAEQGIQAVREKMVKAVQSKGMNGLSTSYHEMDNMLRGLQPGRIYIIAAESGGGKSVLCMNIVSQQVNDKKRVAVFSLEMSYGEVWERIVIHNAHVSANAISGKESINRQEAGKMTALAKRAKAGEIDIITCDKGGQSIEQIVAAIHRQHREKPLDLVVIDYIQLMHSQKRHNSREQEMAYISRTLKGLARQLDIPVVLPTQVNNEGRARESMAIKFDSDAFIHIKDHVIEIEKNRAGPTGSVNLTMEGEFQRFIQSEGDPDKVKVKK